MIDKLRSYIDAIFSQAPQTKKTIEVKEEILQNLIDKYNDLQAEGKSEEAAYNIAVASVGDISELIQELRNSQQQSYAITPEKETAPTETEEQRKKRALITAIAVSLFVLCFIPAILFNGGGFVFMFLMIACGVGLLVYLNMTRISAPPVRHGDTLAAEFKEFRRQGSASQQVYKSITSALWLITIVIYFLVSFRTYAFHLTWLIFLVAAAVQNIIKAAFDIKK